ncbi:uncharacterized protein Dwil_GK27182, partial [Drosophila willistoni]
HITHKTHLSKLSLTHNFCISVIVISLYYIGHIPGRPLGGRHGMVFGQIPAPPAIGNSSVPLVPGAYR